MRRLREQGSTARFLVVAGPPDAAEPRTRRVRRRAGLPGQAGGPAAVRRRDARAGPGGRRPRRSGTSTAAPTPIETGQRAEEMFLSALPHRLSAIAISAQAGDAAAVAAAADDTRRGQPTGSGTPRSRS